MPACSVVSFSGTVQRLKRFIAGRGESGDWIIYSTDDRSELQYDSQPWQNRIYKYTKKKFGKNGFHTLQGTMSHRPLTNASSLKITAAYPAAYVACMAGRNDNQSRLYPSCQVLRIWIQVSWAHSFLLQLQKKYLSMSASPIMSA